jgi:hypothetical protein
MVQVFQGQTKEDDMSELKQGSYTRTEGRQAGGTYPRFFTDSVKDELASAQQGRDIFKAEQRVEIIMPGISQLTKPVEKVNQSHIERWPEEYKRFKDGQEMSVDGIPLEQWPVLKREQVLELKYMGLLTVEHVAGMSETAIQRIPMYGRKLQRLAEAYLDEEKASALLLQTTASNERMERIIAEQNEKIANLSALTERLSSQVITMQNAPSPITTYVPGQHDPIGLAHQGQPQEPLVQSSLMDLPAPRVKRSKAEAAS